MRIVKPAPQIPGAEVREFRKDVNWNQERLAQFLSVSKPYVQKIESAPDPIPTIIAERIFAARQFLLLPDELKKGIGRQQSHKFHDFRRSSNFSLRPPFAALPTCQCGDDRCRLTPVRDGEWAGGIHWWKFQGIRCRKISYLDNVGKIVSPPLRYAGDGVPSKQCTKCGRRQSLGKKFSVRLGVDVYTRYCRTKIGDSKRLEHDPPAHYIERRGKFEVLSGDELEKLRGRNRRVFAVPKCELPGCARHGKTMERSAVIQLRDAKSGAWRIAAYRCRPSTPARPHAAYRVLPNGEIAERSGFGRYRWSDAATGLQHETLNRKRPIRKSRVMPSAECREHHCQLIRISGPWPVRVKGLREKRRRRERPSGLMQCWRARCPVGSESWYVESNGTVRVVKASRWTRPKPGPKPQKQELFAQARKLKDVEHLSWAQIGRKLDPVGFAKNQRAATDRIRVGAEALKKNNARS